MLRAITPHAFSSTELPKCTFFYISTPKNAPRLTILASESDLTSAQMAPHLASLLLEPPEPQIIGKHSESRLFYLSARFDLLSCGSFSSRIFFLLHFSALTLPTSAFPSENIVGSLTSKLPSIISYTSLSHVLNALVLFKGLLQRVTLLLVDPFERANLQMVLDASERFCILRPSS